MKRTLPSLNDTTVLVILAECGMLIHLLLNGQ